MENQLIELENLQIGDEVLVGAGDLKYLKILRLPQKRKNPGVWNPGGYKAIKVIDQRRKLGYPAAVDKEKYYDFNYKNIWLIKR